MDPLEVLSKVRETISQQTVFGEPITQDGVTLVPVAKVSGGAGGGGRPNETDKDAGAGAGFGLRSAPVGVFVLKDGEVSWRPSFDLNRAVLVGQISWIVMMLATRSIVKAVYKHRDADR